MPWKTCWENTDGCIIFTTSPTECWLANGCWTCMETHPPSVNWPIQIWLPNLKGNTTTECWLANGCWTCRETHSSSVDSQMVAESEVKHTYLVLIVQWLLNLKGNTETHPPSVDWPIQIWLLCPVPPRHKQILDILLVQKGQCHS